MLKSSKLGLPALWSQWTTEPGWTLIIDFAKASDLVPHDQLLTKTAALGVELRVVVRKREFLLGHMQRIRVQGQLSEEVKSNVRCKLHLKCDDTW